MTLRTFSYGGGVQSTAALVLAVQGQINFQTFLFANVGDDSEHPATLRYVREVAMPYAEANGIRLEELHKQRRRVVWTHVGYEQRRIYGGMTVTVAFTGRAYRYDDETLYGRLMKQGGRSQAIPVYLSSGAPGSRSCTADFKIRVIGKWLRLNGATAEQPAVTGLGISLDEFQRARSESGIAYQKLVYPLIDMRLSRQDCVQIIERAGLPVPPKSSCWFCPYHSMRKWQDMRDNEPELFWKAVDIERHMSQRRADDAGKDAVWLSRKLVPLDQATSPHRQLPMLLDETEDACESGYCMT
jgi:hypothetical protein